MGSRRTYFLPVATAPVGSRATALCTVLHVVLWLPAAVLVDVSYPPNRILFGVAVFVCVFVCVCVCVFACAAMRCITHAVFRHGVRQILPHQRVLTALDQEEATQGLGSI